MTGPLLSTPSASAAPNPSHAALPPPRRAQTSASSASSVAAVSMASNVVSEANTRNAPVVASTQGAIAAASRASGHSARDSRQTSSSDARPNPGATSRAATPDTSPHAAQTRLMSQNNSGGLWL